jgi:hypothetical protein
MPRPPRIASAVRGQQRAWRYVPVGARHGMQLRGQCRKDGVAGPVRLGPGDLTAEHRDSVPGNHDLRVLGCLAAAGQRQSAEDPYHDQAVPAKGQTADLVRVQIVVLRIVTDCQSSPRVMVCPPRVHEYA